MPYGGYCVEGRGPGEWVVRNGASRVAAIFPTQAEANAYANKVTEMCAPQIPQYKQWERLAKSCR
jgi:hypothetical protein